MRGIRARKLKKLASEIPSELRGKTHNNGQVTIFWDGGRRLYKDLKRNYHKMRRGEL